MHNLKILKVREVKTPNRGTIHSSGIDFFIPSDLEIIHMTPSEGSNENTLLEVIEWEIIIPAGKWVLIPSGIKTIIAPCFDLVFENKSGVAVKKGLVIGAKVIDADYRGEIHIHLINTSNHDQSVSLGDKVAQAILREVYLTDPLEITEEEFNEENNTERGEWGFGSTGTK